MWDSEPVNSSEVIYILIAMKNDNSCQQTTHNGNRYMKHIENPPGETTHNGNRYMKTYNPPGVSCQKKNRLTDAPAPAAAPRGANVAKQPGKGNRLGRLYVIIIERLS